MLSGAAHFRRAARRPPASGGDARDARADARGDRRRTVQPRGLDVGAEARRLSRARVHRRRGVKLRSRRGLELAADFPRLVAELGKQAVDGMVLDGEIVAFDAERQAVVQRAAEPRAAQDRARDRRAERTPVCSTASTCCTSPASTCARRRTRDRRRYLAQCLLPSPLVQLVHAPDDGVALHGGGARERLRGRDRQAQGQPLRSRQALGVVAQGQADAQRGLRRRRLHARARARARRSARCWSATGTGQAALRLARRLGLRRAHAGAGAGAARAAAAQDLSVRRKAGAERADDLGRARSWSPK